jgi:hypothetical protein
MILKIKLKIPLFAFLNLLLLKLKICDLARLPISKLKWQAQLELKFYVLPIFRLFLRLADSTNKNISDNLGIHNPIT